MNELKKDNMNYFKWSIVSWLILFCIYWTVHLLIDWVGYNIAWVCIYFGFLSIFLLFRNVNIQFVEVEDDEGENDV